MSRRPLRATVAIAIPAVFTAALTSALLVGGKSTAVVLFDDTVSFGLALYATACAVLAARAATDRLRRTWVIMAAALGAWSLGDGLWLVYDLLPGVEPTTPSAADAFYLLFGVLLVAAFAQLITTATHQGRFRLLLDAITVALCLFLLAWVLVLNDVYSTYREDRAALAVAFLYPVLDMIALTIAVVVLVRADARQRVMLATLTLAVTLMSIADSAFAHLTAGGRYSTGDLLDVLWAASLTAFAAAAVLSREAHEPRTVVVLPSTASLWLPYVPLLLAGTIGPPLVMSGLEQFLVPAVVVAVCARQVVSAWENRRLLATAAEQALRDPLTGLANRSLFSDRLAHAMTLRARDDRSIAVVSLDLDDFRLVNDTLGHPAADSVLAVAGQRIAECIRPGDTAARIGGDAFALLLEDRTGDSHQIAAQRILTAFRRPFRIDDQEMLLHPSVGVAVASPAEPDLDAATLIKRADIAMYAAKRSRCTQVRVFDADMPAAHPDAVQRAETTAAPPLSEGAARIRLLGELRQAIDRRGLQVVYQPQIDLGTGRIVGVEALLRWPHPHLGTLHPDTFLPLVRQHGLMRPVTDLVIDQSLADVAGWARQGIRLPVAVNLFAPSLRDTSLPDTLSAALQQRGLTPELLTVEITEDLVLSEVSTVTTVLHRLRQLGIRIAIDDFGSGYSALSYLRDLPIDEIKLDRHFIAHVTTNPKAAAVVDAVINLTHTLDITVVAEGVEDVDTATWLTDHRCDVAQGYLYGRPTTADDIPRFLDTQRAAHVGVESSS